MYLEEKYGPVKLHRYWVSVVLTISSGGDRRQLLEARKSGGAYFKQNRAQTALASSMLACTLRYSTKAIGRP